jgi:hypothetical protein
LGRVLSFDIEVELQSTWSTHHLESQSVAGGNQYAKFFALSYASKHHVIYLGTT